MRGRFIGWVVAIFLIVVGFAKPFAGRVNAAPPIAYDSAFTLYEDWGNPPFAITLTATDADGDPLTLTIITPPAHGTLSGNPHYDLGYEPDEEYSGTDSFVFSASDGTNSDTGTVTLNIIETDDFGILTDPYAPYQEGFPILARPSGVPVIMDGAPGNPEPWTVVDVDTYAPAAYIDLKSSAGGRITLSTVAGLTFTRGDGTDDTEIDFSGTYAAVNTALDGLIFTPSPSLLPGQSEHLFAHLATSPALYLSDAYITVTIAPEFEDTYVINGTLEECDKEPQQFYFEVYPITASSNSIVRASGTFPGSGRVALNTDRPYRVMGNLDFAYGFDGTDNPEMTVGYNPPLNYYLAVESDRTGAYSITLDGTNLTIGEALNCGNLDVYPASLTIEIDLQGRPTPPHPSWVLPLYITIIAGDTSQISFNYWQYHPINSDENGFITIDPLPADADARISVWTPGMLHALADDFPLIPGENYFYALLRAGNADGNSRVDLFDFSRLAGAFGTSTGHPRFNPNTDFNGDGMISLLDFSLLALNFGATAG